jgi:hypothetical protein
MLEAIDVLKGVLGFDESLSSQSKGGISPSSTTAIEPLQPPPPIQDLTPVSPRKKQPPPLPSRSHLQENSKSRPSLPTIVSASIIDRQRGSGGRTATGNDGSIGPLSPPTSHDELQIVLDDDIDEEGDTFADPTPTRATKYSKRTSSPSSRPAVPPRKRKLGSQSSGGEDVVNRTRSQSDPFADTHGHLSYGHGRKGTQGSLGGGAPGTSSPSSRPLLAPSNTADGGSSVSTGTTGESVLYAAGDKGGTTGSGSGLKRPVPLPPEDFELDETRHVQAGTDPPTLGEQPDTDEEDTGYGEQDFDGRKVKPGAFGLTLVGARRGSETTGLGLLGAGSNINTVKGYSVDSMPRSYIPTSRSRSEGETGRSSKPTHLSSLSNPTSLSNLTTLSRPTTPDVTLMLTSSTFTGGGIIGAEQHTRTWVVPSYLGNPEIAKLLTVFPISVTRGSVPRFKSAIKHKSKKKGKGKHPDAEVDLEAQGADESGVPDELEYVRHGTGRMWIGDSERSEDWRGTIWDRFIGWWRKVFC